MDMNLLCTLMQSASVVVNPSWLYKFCGSRLSFSPGCSILATDLQPPLWLPDVDPHVSPGSTGWSVKPVERKHMTASWQVRYCGNPPNGKNPERVAWLGVEICRMYVRYILSALQ